jgi:hypothetical protein
MYQNRVHVIMHIGIKKNLGNLQRLMSDPALNLHQVEARAQPVRHRRFAKSVGIMFLSNGPRYG